MAVMISPPVFRSWHGQLLAPARWARGRLLSLLYFFVLPSPSVFAFVEEVVFSEDSLDASSPEYWSLLLYDVGLDPGASIDIRLSLKGTSSRASLLTSAAAAASPQEDPVPAPVAPLSCFVMLITHDQWVNWNEDEPFSLPDGELSSYLQANWRAPLVFSPTSSASSTAAGFSEDLSFRAKFRLPRTAGRGSVLGPDRYHLGILNPSKVKLAGIAGTIEVVNPNSRLPLQQQHLPQVYHYWMWGNFASAVCAFLLYCTVWRWRSTTISRDGAVSSSFTTIPRNWMHLAFTGVFLYKAIACCLLEARLIAVSQREASGAGASSSTAEDEEFFASLLSDVRDSFFLTDFLPRLFAEKVSTIVELELLLVLSLGFQMLRQRLNVTEIRFLLGIAAISFYLGIFELTCGSAASCSGYKLSRDILHSLVFLVVFVACNFNLHSLGVQIADATVQTAEVTRLYGKHESYWWLRCIFLYYLAVPTVLLFLNLVILDWQSHWLFVAVHEFSSWLLIASCCFVFQPGFGKLPVFQGVVGSEDGHPEINQNGEDEEGSSQEENYTRSPGGGDQDLARGGNSDAE